MTGARIMSTLLNDLETMDRDDRPRDDVRRRRPGHGDARGAAQLALSALALVLALGSSIVWGAADFSGGSLTKRLPTFAVTVVSQAAGFVALVVAVAIRGDVGGAVVRARPRWPASAAARAWRRSTARSRSGR